MIRLEDVSSEFAKLLLHAGWNPGRQVETSPWTSRLDLEGFKSNPTALAILESLGGLSVRLPPAGINPYEHELRFDPVTAATGEVDRAEGWRDVLGVDLYPIGHEVRTGNVLWVGSDERFYFGHGFGLYRLGDTLSAAMGQLAFPLSPLEICAD